jgi:hypothetical protein
VAKAMSRKQSIFDRLEKLFAGKNPSLKDEGGGKLTRLDLVVTFPSFASCLVFPVYLAATATA